MSKITTLKTELELPEYAQIVATQNYPGIAALLNQKPLIPNPVPQEELPKQLTLVNLFQAITPQEAVDTFKIPGLLDRIESVANGNDRVNIAILFEVVKTYISQNSKDNLANLLALTEPDPNWQSQIFGQSRSEELNIYPVNEQEVQEALN
ncbi:MAG: hypothetical protein HWQ36_26275 [Nostoc sp. NMS2]|uniref:hypothetical protein n=1 Tax=Nostoc sp. NMS2 TaxID=2815389 RepID=UPI0025E12FAE|nr:hypothetical protein [Nostoc sp. NMS2]MBN3993895.1 hypothetical protein [Nostoc sp. NMS2]